MARETNGKRTQAGSVGDIEESGPRRELSAVEGDAALNARLMPEGYKARVERVMLIKVLGWDVNCPQHIP